MLVAITVVVSNSAALGDSVTIPMSLASFTRCIFVVFVVTSLSVVTLLSVDSSVVVCTNSSSADEPASWLGAGEPFSGRLTVVASLLGSSVLGLAREGFVVVGLKREGSVPSINS